MMLYLLETVKTLSVLAAVCVLGLFTRLTARNLYKRLMRETDNMALTKSRFLRELRQRAENSYRLNQGIANTQAYLEKQLMSCRFLGITLNGWGNLSSQLTILCFLAGGIGSFAAYWYRCDNYYVVLYGSMGILAGLLTMFVDCGVNLPERRSQLIGCLQDYMENSLFRRLEKETAQTEEGGRESVRGFGREKGVFRDPLPELGENEAERPKRSVSRAPRPGQRAVSVQNSGNGDIEAERPARKSSRNVKKAAEPQPVMEAVPEEPQSQREMDYIRRSLEQIAASKEKTRPDRNWMKELSDDDLTVVGEILRQYLT